MRRRLFGLLSVCAFTVAVTISADAAVHPIAAVEVSTNVSRAGKDMRAALRNKVEKQLQAVDWGTARKGGPFVLSTSLHRLETSTKEGAAHSQCSVSMALRDQKKGVLKAIVEGRAQAEDRGGAEAAEEEALRTAVRSAVRSLPEAIRRSR